MNKIYESIMALGLAVILSLSPTSNAVVPRITYAAESDISLSKSSLKLKIGKSATLRLKGTKKKVKWSSDNKKVAKVSSKGKVTAVGIGSCYVIAKVGKTKWYCWRGSIFLPFHQS